MRLTRIVMAAVATGAVALAAAAVPALAHGTELEAALHGSVRYPNTRGHVDYERGSGHRDLHLEASHMARLAGRRVTIYAGGVKVGTARVGRLGRCHLERDTAHGQGVPKLSVGSTVRIRTAGGALVASGVLHAHHHE